ncbi:TonB-dependent receptor [Chitinophaga sp. YR627]|uniref:TonB-dependent receptor n=1 Tax=Chitinophaga sp. YR627 TaxID=1881041 RepID=UPI000B7F80C0|nr:TonB-dependent receptor [Chitinophaga sp. YR627]
MSFNRVLTLLPLLLLTLFTTAQTTIHINGSVKNAQSQPIPGVSIQVANTSNRAMTDDNGRFTLKVSNTGKVQLIITSVGFEKLVKEVDLQADLTLHLTLQSNEQQINQVEVNGKSQTRQLKESGFSINAIDTKLYANSTADLGQVLNRTTGIKMREQGGVGSDFNFSINGLSGNAVKFFIDGIPLDIMGSTMTLNNIPVNIADRVEVYKGVAPVSLGSDALGGSVNIITNQHLYNYLDASYSYGSFNTHQSAINGQYVHQPTGIVLKLSGFYNHSDNNYLMKGVEIWDNDANEYVKKDLRRFHDNYTSVMGQLELGIANKKWADVLFIGGSYSRFDRDIQTGIVQSIVYGGVTRDGHARNFNLRYKKDNLLHGRLGLNFYAATSRDESVLTDTTKRKYYWDGSYIDGNPETGSFRVTHIIRPRVFSRFNANYKLAENHHVNLNYSFDRTKNETYNSLDTDVDPLPGKIAKHLGGLSYQMDLFDKRWTNTFMGKYYGLQLSKLQYDYNLLKNVLQSSFKSYYGYGLASVFKITPAAGVKASFEHTYRLQQISEVFGDSYQVSNNLGLDPEASDNINIGGFYGRKVASHEFYVEAAGFFRSAKGFIYASQSDNNQLQYKNLADVLVRGGEAEIRYTYNKLLNAVLNITYQNAIDNTMYPNGSNSGTVSATYKDKIPNQPWLYGNAELGIGKNDLLGKDTRLQFNWSSQYTHWYYRSWEGFATQNSLVTIPTQFIHNALVSYSMQQNRYNISVECKNLTNTLAYDNFRLQKPGRAFYVKLRYFLK